MLIIMYLLINTTPPFVVRASVWSMPGGFSSLSGRGGYEDLDAGRDVEANTTPRPAPKPSTVQPQAPAAPTSQPPGGYQTSGTSSS